ncbi:hypothetical protein RhiirB3_407006 [Rhizophagus irregularis]|nr:hypothetical protein RhiirB3_407006 [Rhizophagus irregularis]
MNIMLVNWLKTLGNYLNFVEYLFLDFHIDLFSFEYFTKNYYLKYVNNYQKGHNSLKILGINKEIINSLKDQSINIFPSDELDKC